MAQATTGTWGQPSSRLCSAASHETALPLIMSATLCLPQSLSWKILTPEITMIYRWNGNSLSDPNLYSTEDAITKTQMKQENANTHTCIYMSLYRYVYTGIYYISPLWHKSQEQKRSFVTSKGFSVQLFRPERQACQGEVQYRNQDLALFFLWVSIANASYILLILSWEMRLCRKQMQVQ